MTYVMDMFPFEYVTKTLHDFNKNINFFMNKYFIYIRYYTEVYYMGSVSNAVLNGVAIGLYNTTNMAFGALTSFSMRQSGLDPFMTLYPNLDSSSGFSSWAHSSYATPFNVIANANGLDTTFAPFTSAISNSFSFGGLLGSNIFGYGFNNPSIYINSNTYTPLGCIPRFNGYF